MSDIYKSRTIRPSSRLETSTSYKINVKNVSENDTLYVTVKHESKPFHKVFKFSGKKLSGRKSIHFRTIEDDII